MEDRGKVISSDIFYHKEEVNTYILYLPEGSKEAAVIIFTEATPIPKDHKIRIVGGEKRFQETAGYRNLLNRFIQKEGIGEDKVEGGVLEHLPMGLRVLTKEYIDSSKMPGLSKGLFYLLKDHRSIEATEIQDETAHVYYSKRIKLNE
ncbi:MAG: hypothetical protein QW231_02295 [Candidatus Bathyarchaeia archaeon]